jgi:hypothetical protein
MPTTTRKPFQFGDFLVTRADWARKPRDYRLGDPRKGTARMLALVDGAGTCLVPATVHDGLAFLVRAATSQQRFGRLFCADTGPLAVTGINGGVLALIHRDGTLPGFLLELPGASEDQLPMATLEIALSTVYGAEVALS